MGSTGSWLPFGCGSKPMVPFWEANSPPILVYCSGDWDVHWGYGVLTHGHFNLRPATWGPTREASDLLLRARRIGVLVGGFGSTRSIYQGNK